MHRIPRFFVKRCLSLAVILVLIVAAMSVAVMALWNWLMPTLLNTPRIDFYQAAGLLALCRLLLMPLFGHRCPGKRWAHRGRHHWREQMRERWQQLPEAERSKLREQMRRRWRC